MGAGEGSASRTPAPARSELTLRVLSAIVLGTALLGLTYYGGLAFNLVWLAASLAVLVEWLKMTRAEPFAPLLAALSTALVGAAGLVFFKAAPVYHLAPLALVLIASLALGRSGRDRAWAASGALYAGILAVVPAGIREQRVFAQEEFGRDVLLWLYGVVWTTDIAAYFVGRAVGGAKLWPRVSPKKTWSGFAGGLVFGVAVGLALPIAYDLVERGRLAGGFETYLLIAAAAAAVSLLTHAGDLLESALKRYCVIKDASQLIPGHGGVMDRLDGFWAVCAVLLLVALATTAA